MEDRARTAWYSRIIALVYFAYTAAIVLINLLPPNYRATGTLGYFFFNASFIPILLINGVGFLLNETKVLRSLKILNIIILILVVLFSLYSINQSISAPAHVDISKSSLILNNLLSFTVAIALLTVSLYLMYKVDKAKNKEMEQLSEQSITETASTNKTEQPGRIIKVMATLHAIIGTLDIFVIIFIVLVGLLTYESFGQTYSEFTDDLFSLRSFKAILNTVLYFSQAWFLWRLKQNRITLPLVLGIVIIVYAFISGSIVGFLGIPLSAFTILYLLQLRGRPAS